MTKGLSLKGPTLFSKCEYWRVMDLGTLLTGPVVNHDFAHTPEPLHLALGIWTSMDCIDVWEREIPFSLCGAARTRRQEWRAVKSHFFFFCGESLPAKITAQSQTDCEKDKEVILSWDHKTPWISLYLNHSIHPPNAYIFLFFHYLSWITDTLAKSILTTRWLFFYSQV